MRGKSHEWFIEVFVILLSDCKTRVFHHIGTRDQSVASFISHCVKSVWILFCLVLVFSVFGPEKTSNSDAFYAVTYNILSAI